MYKKTLNLKHHEKPAKIDLETGEFIEINDRPNNIPNNKEVFEKTAIFYKNYENTWNFLNKVLSPIEYKAAHTLAMMSKANTNSLEPLNDSTTINTLMDILNVSKNKVKPILSKLFDLGVYGMFEVKNADKPYTKYWILNPYLSFKGKIIDTDIAKLFKGTHCAKAFYNSEYKYKRI